MKFFCLLGLTFFLFACSVNKYSVNQPSKPSKLTQFYCSGDRKLLAENQLNSESLYEQMRVCLIKEDYVSATFLFSLSGSLSWYEAATGGNEGLKNKHVMLLKNSLAGVPSEKIDQFWVEVHSTLGTPAALVVTCDKLLTLAPAIEAPMLRSSITWQTALENYLHCPLANTVQ